MSKLKDWFDEDCSKALKCRNVEKEEMLGNPNDETKRSRGNVKQRHEARTDG